MQLVTKIDESVSQTGEMVMAGYAGRLADWQNFDLQWPTALRDAGLAAFHSFEHWSHPFAKRAHLIAGDHLMVGFAVRLQKADYIASYRNAPWGAKGARFVR